MKEILVFVCDCGEDIYEDDQGPDTLSGHVECINCCTQYPIGYLKKHKLFEITHKKRKA